MMTLCLPVCLTDRLKALLTEFYTAAGESLKTVLSSAFGIPSQNLYQVIGFNVFSGDSYCESGDKVTRQIAVARNSLWQPYHSAIHRSAITCLHVQYTRITHPERSPVIAIRMCNFCTKSHPVQCEHLNIRCVRYVTLQFTDQRLARLHAQKSHLHPERARANSKKHNTFTISKCFYY